METIDEGGLPQLKALDWQAVILANGDFPQTGRALQILRSTQTLICCDGAYRLLRAEGIEPLAVVGDGDSIDPKDRHRLGARFHLVAEQADNDLTKAVRHAQGLGLRRLLVLGATGKREDHTLGNISLLEDYARMGLQVGILTDHGLFLHRRGNATFPALAGQQISVFNLTCTGMESSGLRYPLYTLRKWWQGTLNEATGSTFSVTADGDYLIYFVQGRKNRFH